MPVADWICEPASRFTTRARAPRHRLHFCLGDSVGGGHTTLMKCAARAACQVVFRGIPLASAAAPGRAGQARTLVLALVLVLGLLRCIANLMQMSCSFISPRRQLFLPLCRQLHSVHACIPPSFPAAPPRPHSRLHRRISRNPESLGKPKRNAMHRSLGPFSAAGGFPVRRRASAACLAPFSTGDCRPAPLPTPRRLGPLCLDRCGCGTSGRGFPRVHIAGTGLALAAALAAVAQSTLPAKWNRERGRVRAVCIFTVAMRPARRPGPPLHCPDTGRPPRPLLTRGQLFN